MILKKGVIITIENNYQTLLLFNLEEANVQFFEDNSKLR